MIVQVTRFVLLIAGGFGGFAVSRFAVWSEQTDLSSEHVIFTFVILGCSIGYLIGGIVGREALAGFRKLEERLHDMRPTDLMLGAAGLLSGLLVGLLLSYPLGAVRPAWLSSLATAALLAVFADMGVRISMLKREAVAVALARLNGVAPVSASLPTKYLDTSAVIDGRFAELARAGFLEGEMKVPRFVVAELQTLADSADDMKRGRGRRGLDLLETLIASDMPLEMLEADYPDTPLVDEKLVRLAKDAGGLLVTVDHNLTKAARVQGVTVLNINESAAALRPLYLPGETVRLTIVREGKEADQGVGYLEDGTMVVVQGGRRHIGDETETEVTSVLQTSAGRMIFTKLKAG